MIIMRKHFLLEILNYPILPISKIKIHNILKL